MEEKQSSKRKPRPAQKLYVPPAQRSNKKILDKRKTELNSIESNPVDIKTNDRDYNAYCASPLSMLSPNPVESFPKDEEPSLVIMLNEAKISEDKRIDFDQEEMERAFVNINRKSRPLIKHVNVGNNDVLHIHVQKDVKVNNKNKDGVGGEQVASWEDLLNEEDDINRDITREESEGIEEKVDSFSDEEHEPSRKYTDTELDHVIELYDFPSSFKTQDIMQVYHGINRESMYIKWCDETHALLVLGTQAQASRALQLRHDLIKSRTMNNASSIANQVASKCDLRPAMKRPQTNMQTARRLINSHLGTRVKISKEEQAREREELRKAKELKRAQKQCEYDAWLGNPRPSTA